jgi:hypothetical protein
MWPTFREDCYVTIVEDCLSIFREDCYVTMVEDCLSIFREVSYVTIMEDCVVYLQGRLLSGNSGRLCVLTSGKSIT